MNKSFSQEHPTIATVLLSSVFILLGLICTPDMRTQEVSLPQLVQPSNTHQVAQPSLRDPEYVISSDDVLDIYILDVPELSRQYTVSAAGTVAIPLITDPQAAAGLTLVQFSQRLEEVLRNEEIVGSPHVITSVRASRQHAISVVGAVQKPQLYEVYGRTTLLDVLSQAGGTTPTAGNIATIARGDIALAAIAVSNPSLAASDLEVMRTVRVDLEGLLQRADPTLNVAVYPGDRVTVAVAGIVYVVGSVNRPGGFPLGQGKQNMTVLQAIALAEDLKTTAIRDKAVIIHNDVSEPSGHKQIPVNLKKLLAGKSPDLPLEADDILFIPDSTGKRALRRGAEAALQVAAGVAIYRP